MDPRIVTPDPTAPHRIDGQVWMGIICLTAYAAFTFVAQVLQAMPSLPPVYEGALDRSSGILLWAGLAAFVMSLARDFARKPWRSTYLEMAALISLAILLNGILVLLMRPDVPLFALHSLWHILVPV